MTNSIIAFFICGLTFSGIAQVKDIDGNIYQTVRIGNQEWMAENLNVTHFRNGDPIPDGSSVEGWKNAQNERKPAMSEVNNESTNVKKYGKYYNVFVILDPRGVAPEGWHIPSKLEWQELVKYLGNYPADEMKTKAGWDPIDKKFECPNCVSWSNEYRRKVPCDMCKDTRRVTRTIIGGSNKSGFSAIPIGYRTATNYEFFNKQADFWTSTATIYSSDNKYLNDRETPELIMWSEWLSVFSDGLTQTFESSAVFGKVGRSIRCIRNIGFSTEEIEAENRQNIKILEAQAALTIKEKANKTAEIEKASKEDYIRNINEKKSLDSLNNVIISVKNKPLSSVETNFIGYWELKSEKIFSNTNTNEIFVFEEFFDVKSDRSYTYRAYFRKWLEKSNIMEYNEKGLWEIKDNTFCAYINEEDGKPSTRIDKLKFDAISDKKASRTVKLLTDVPPIKISGKKVQKANFDEDTFKSIMQGK